MAFRCPNWLFNWVHNGRFEAGSPDPSAINDVYEIMQEHTRDISTLNTGLGRVERKQNRWIEILNLKENPDDGSLSLTRTSAPAMDSPSPQPVPAPEAGAETMDINFEQN
ncbi:hypothetical protein ES703_76309 [subsurface metagenome]